MRQHSVDHDGAIIHYADRVAIETDSMGNATGPFRWGIELGGSALGSTTTLEEARRLVDLVRARGLR